MKFKIIILIFLFLPVFGYGQQTNSPIISNIWTGKIKVGDTNHELVFNIFIDSLGQLAGNLGIPGKGIKDIPFDKTSIKKDSIQLIISDAQASYRGVFIEESMMIKGTWQEGQHKFPLVLMPLTREIDYANIKRDIPASLSLGLASEHFELYSKKQDAKVLEVLSKVLEANYIRITSNMQTSFDSKIYVFIYPDLKAFHSAINYPAAPDWVVGAAGIKELKMVSPLNPGDVHSYQSLMKAIVHELTHTVVLNLRKQGIGGLPNWLNEGYAYYEAGQITENEYRTLYSKLINDEIPSWDELKNANTIQFGDLGGYGLSSTIIEFLVQTYGYGKLRQYIIEPESVERIYGLSEEELEILWKEYLKNTVEDNYKTNIV